MKKATMIIWLVIFGFIALVIFQNQTFFQAKTAFRLNLGIQEYAIPETYNAVVLLVFFFFGLIIAYLFSFSARFKAKRTIKKLNATIAGHINEVAELNSEINKLKGLEAPVDEKADTMVLDMNKTQKIPEDNAAESNDDKTVKFDTTSTTSNPSDSTEATSGDKKA
jgi:hypothetical protein